MTPKKERKVKVYKVTTCQVVNYGQKNFLYVVTESGQILFGEHLPESNDIAWTRINVVPVDSPPLTKLTKKR